MEVDEQVKFRWQNAVILALICALVGCAVALTWSVAGPEIDRQAAETADNARRELFPEAESFEAQTVPADRGIDACYAALRGGELLGYTAQVTVSGSQGMIEVIAGVDSAGRVTGIKVGGSGFSETPGLGAKTRDAAFTGQYAGKGFPVRLNEDVDQITGATISSAAVTDAVNLAGDYILSLFA